MEQWHLIYTKRHQETAVNKMLQEKGWETFLPGVEIERGYGRGRRLEPFFSQYIFIRVDLTSTKAQQLPYMTGVSKVVAFGNTPIIIPEDVVEEIRGRYEEYMERKAGLEPAVKVRIPSSGGRKIDLDALFDPKLDASMRSQLLLHALLR